MAGAVPFVVLEVIAEVLGSVTVGKVEDGASVKDPDKGLSVSVL